MPVGADQQPLGAVDEHAVPSGDVLFVERYEASVLVGSGGAPGLRVAHQRGQPQYLWLVRQELGQQQRQVQRVGRKRCDGPTVAVQLPIDGVGAVHRFQQRRKSLGEPFPFGYHEGYARIADALLRAHQALRHGRWFHGERHRDGRRIDTEHHLQHQRRSDRFRDGRVRADHHQREPAIGKVGGGVVEFDCFVVHFIEWDAGPVRGRLPRVAEPVAGDDE